MGCPKDFIVRIRDFEWYIILIGSLRHVWNNDHDISLATVGICITVRAASKIIVWRSAQLTTARLYPSSFQTLH